jgi:hypothetical protein
LRINFILFANIEQTATKFNAETHQKLFQQTFKNLNISDVSSFAIAQIADSTTTNPKIAQLLKIAHIGCRNHCLNLGCKDTESNCPELKKLADKTREVHRKIKASNKLTAELDKVQAISRALDESCQTGTGRLKMKAPTRWNMLEGLLTSHVDCADRIHQVIVAHPERDISDKNTSQDFIKKIKKHITYLGHIKSASIGMQKKLATLKECQFLCNLVAICAAEGQGKAGNDFRYCK